MSKRYHIFLPPLFGLLLLAANIGFAADEKSNLPAQSQIQKGEIREMAIQKRLFASPADYFCTPQLKSFQQSKDSDKRNKPALEQLNYKVEEQTMFLFVPENYDGGPGWGMFVYTSPVPNGAITNQYHSLMEKHKLIYVAPNNADNSKPLFFRMGLTLDAFATVKSLYRIDPERVYAAGLSGGGTIATTEAVYYPEIFHGLINFSSQYFLIKSPSYLDNYTYNRRWTDADTRALKKFSYRFAFNTGDRDKNYNEVKAAVKAWSEIGLDAKLFDQPGLGHTLPSAEYLDKMLTWIQEPQDQAVEQSLKTMMAKKNYPEALAMVENIRAMPSWKTQVKLGDETFAELDKIAAAEADKLLNSPKINLASERDFSRKWKSCPSSKKVFDHCEAEGAKLADALLSQSNCQPAVLKKFLYEWEEFPCCEKIASAYDKAGAALWSTLQAKKEGDIRILDFIGQYSGFSCAEEAVKIMNPKGDDALAKLLAKPKYSATDLRNFIKKWKGLDAAEKARSELYRLSEAEYAKLDTGKKRKSQLQSFCTQFGDTPAGERAKKELGR